MSDPFDYRTAPEAFVDENAPIERNVHRTAGEIREHSIVTLLGSNVMLRKRLEALYRALGLLEGECSHEEAVAVAEALRGYFERAQ